MKISVIYASLPKRNPGMISVNRAFGSWLRWSGIAAEVSEYQLGKRHSAWDSPPAVELYGRLDEALDADVVIYWGDWLQMRHYHEDLARAFHRGRWVEAKPSQPPGSLAETARVIREHLLLEGRPIADLKKTLLIGGTLALSSPQDLALASYSEPLKRLITHSALVLMRDLPSANIARSMRVENPVDPCCGCDCAMLLDTDIIEGPETSKTGGTATAFLGRNRGAKSRRYTSFVRDLCASAQVAPSWIDWFPEKQASRRLIPRAVRRLQQAFPRLGESRDPGHESAEGTSLSDILSAVRASRFTITDTYHLAVNCWNLGIPAVCIAGTVDSLPWSVNSGARHAWRDKRYEFYSMIEAMPYFVHASELAAAMTRRSRLRQLADLLVSGDDQTFIAMQRIAQLRDRTKMRIRETVRVVSELKGPE